MQVKEYQPQDAAAVARLYQASDPAWPDGFTDNVLPTTEGIEREMTEENVLNTYLAWEDEKAVGFVNLIQIPDDEKAGYVGLLTSDPEYHGRGVGRDLIRRCIDRAVELGHTRITLGTWPGNTKAVPLYKKTGFHWGPDQHGWNELQNHVPLLLTHPLTKRYFEVTDWYACYKRDLSLGLDTQKRNHTLVFPYEWDGEAGQLRAVFDQRTKKLVELDTPDLSLTLAAAQPEMLRGAEQIATLRAVSKMNEPLTIAVAARDDGPVKAEHYEVLNVPAGGAGTAEVKITADAEKSDYGAASLKLLVNSHPLEMAATVRVLPALELQMEPESLALRAFQSASATLNLHNRTEESMEVRLLVQPAEGLVATLAKEHQNLAAGEVVGVPIELCAAVGGVYPITISPVVTVGEHAKPHPPLTMEVAAVAPAQVQVTRKEDETLLFTEDLSLAIAHKEPWHTVRERRTGKALLNQSFNAGPPYWPSPLDEERAEVSVQKEPGMVRVTLRSKMKGLEGMRFERTITMHANSTVTASASLANLSGSERTISIRYSATPADDQAEDAAYFPLPEGVVRGHSTMPGYRWDGAGSEPSFTARWLAMERDGWTFGILWPEGLTTRSYASSWERLSLRAPDIATGPGATMRMEEITLLPTLGGWPVVEREWQERQHITKGTSQVVPAAGARLVPAPLLLLDEPVTAAVEARYIHPRAEGATVQIGTPDGLAVEPGALTFSEISSVGNPTMPVTVTTTATRCAAELALEMRHPGYQGNCAAPVIALGSSRGKVLVEETTDQGESVWCVENGWLSFGVRPGVLGHVYSLSSPAGEHLYA
ncbi:MAG: GNAT family N-acetyltransferase, partial [Chloroflexota bacterium]|nr:GNAT family N-acetyltransferase [Chloroflexota bacterium]